MKYVRVLASCQAAKASSKQFRLRHRHTPAQPLKSSSKHPMSQCTTGYADKVTNT